MYNASGLQVAHLLTESQVKDKWKSYTQLSPNVALAALNTAGNIALAIAIGKGVAISWWRRAMHGASVNHLHNSWSFSTSVLDLLTAGKRFNLIALCALTAKIAIVDNVLLQKATSSAPGFYTQSNTSVQIPVVSEIPPNWFGTTNSDDSSWTPSFFFSNDLYQWQVSADLVNFVPQINVFYWDNVTTNCFGDCYVGIPAFGFNVTCNETLSQPREDVTPAYDGNTIFNSSLSGAANAPLDALLFSDMVRVRHGQPILWNNGTNRTFDQDVIQIVTKWAELTSKDENDLTPSTCAAKINIRQCVLQPAEVSYNADVADTRNKPDWVPKSIANSVENKNSGVQLLSVGSIPYDPYYSSYNFSTGQLYSEYKGLGAGKVVGKVYSPWDDKWQGNMGVLAQAFQAQFASYVELGYNASTGYTSHPRAIGAMASYWTDFTTGAIRTNQSSCVMAPQDPMNYIISQINSIMFRSSISAAFTGDFIADPLPSGFFNLPPIPANVKTLVADWMYSPSVLYSAEWPFMIAAAVVMFVCICFILPSYWGYWELGRKVTLGPMEIASAFQAPVLQHGEQGAPGGGEVNKLLEVVGKRQVLYGQTEDGKLAMAGPSDVNRLPKVGPTLKIAGHTL